jgi:hypothetical protein
MIVLHQAVPIVNAVANSASSARRANVATELPPPRFYRRRHILDDEQRGSFGQLHGFGQLLQRRCVKSCVDEIGETGARRSGQSG